VHATRRWSAVCIDKSVTRTHGRPVARVFADSYAHGWPCVCVLKIGSHFN